MLTQKKVKEIKEEYDADLLEALKDDAHWIKIIEKTKNAVEDGDIKRICHHFKKMKKALSD